MSEDPLEDALPLLTSPSAPDVEDEILSQDLVVPVKRKGGRKPVYATLEERKQRNRQAQAAFRERRTEYIKQLEDAMKENEEAMQQLQQSNREVTEECHMLRYKTSLLEDLLYENGIDFQSELQARSSKSLLASPYPPQGSIRGSWPQPSAQEINRDRRPRPQAPTQKLKHKARSSNSHSVDTQQSPTGQNLVRNDPHCQSAYSFLQSPEYRIGSLSLNQEPPSRDHAGFDHANGGVHLMQAPIHSNGHPFDESQFDSSLSRDGRPESFYAAHAGQMADYLGRERFAGTAIAHDDASSHHNRLAPISRFEQNGHHHLHHSMIPPLTTPSLTGGITARASVANVHLLLQGEDSFNQNPCVGLEGTMGISGTELPHEVPFGDELTH